MSEECERCDGAGLRGADRGHGGLVGITGRHYHELTEAKRLLDLREQQLADCTRALREVATELDGMMPGFNWFPSNLAPLINKLNAVRAGKPGT